MADQRDAPDQQPPAPQHDAPDLDPDRPEPHGVPDAEPDPMDHEAARLLANEARPELEAQGFDDEQILAWATTYTARYGSGDAARFLAWIDAEQRDR